MKKLILLFLLITSIAYASDTHQSDSTHVVAYTVADAAGNHVSGQTIRLTLYNPKTNQYYDFSDNTFKAQSSVTTLHRTMNENNVNGVYFTTVTIDNSTLVSSDVIMTVSNDSGTYGDLQSETVSFDRLEDMILINR